MFSTVHSILSVLQHKRNEEKAKHCGSTVIPLRSVPENSNSEKGRSSAKCHLYVKYKQIDIEIPDTVEVEFNLYDSGESVFLQ